MRVPIELTNVHDVEDFVNIVKGVPCDVRLKGLDENGNPWDISAKSLLCSLVISTKYQHHREHTAHEVDWNTIYCECEKDIYNLIQKFVKGGSLD